MQFTMNSPNRNNDRYLVLYFQVHQPRRLQSVNFFDIPKEPNYFNDELNESVIRRVAAECYLPTNQLLLELIEHMPNIRISFSMSGIVLEQLERYAPDALESFQELARTGAVEFLGETYYHSLASLVDGDEFETQVLHHAGKIQEVFGLRPSVFRNTELIYNDTIGERVARLGFHAIFTEGHESILGDKTPHDLYCHPEFGHLKIFLRNYQLSDDIAFRFIQNGSRLEVQQFLHWLYSVPEEHRLVTLAMDYETFGEHHKSNSGILQFLGDMFTAVIRDSEFTLEHPSRVLKHLAGNTPLSMKNYLSWGDTERDLSAWLGNDMQKDAFHTLMRLEGEVKSARHSGYLKCWRYLQTSDHFYYMSTKADNDGSVHSYFSPFPSAYEAFISFMNAVSNMSARLHSSSDEPAHDKSDQSSSEAERQEVKAGTPVWVMNLESVPHGNVPGSEN
jgi:alpha-amylase